MHRRSSAYTDARATALQVGIGSESLTHLQKAAQDFGRAAARAKRALAESPDSERAERTRALFDAQKKHITAVEQVLRMTVDPRAKRVIKIALDAMKKSHRKAHVARFSDKNPCATNDEVGVVHQPLCKGEDAFLDDIEPGEGFCVGKTCMSRESIVNGIKDEQFKLYNRAYSVDKLRLAGVIEPPFDEFRYDIKHLDDLESYTHWNDNPEMILLALSYTWRPVYALTEWAAPDVVDDLDDQVVRALEKNPRFAEAFEHLSPKFRDDVNIVMTAVEKDASSTFRHVSDRLRNDRSIVFAAVTDWGSALQYASDRLRSDHEIVRRAVMSEGAALQFASPGARGTKEIVRMAVLRDPLALQFATQPLRDDTDIVILAVSKDGLALRHAGRIARRNEYIVKMAVTRNGMALQWAKVQSRDIVMLAVASPIRRFGPDRNDRRSKQVLQFADRKYRNDDTIAVAAVDANPYELQYTNKSRPVVVSALVGIRSSVFKFPWGTRVQELTHKVFQHAGRLRSDDDVRYIAYPRFLLPYNPNREYDSRSPEHKKDPELDVEEEESENSVPFSGNPCEDNTNGVLVPEKRCHGRMNLSEEPIKKGYCSGKNCVDKDEVRRMTGTSGYRDPFTRSIVPWSRLQELEILPAWFVEEMILDNPSLLDDPQFWNNNKKVLSRLVKRLEWDPKDKYFELIERMLALSDDTITGHRQLMGRIAHVSPSMLKFASESIKKDREIMLLAVTSFHSMTFDHAHESLRKDRNFVYAALSMRGGLYDHPFLHDEELAFRGVLSSPITLGLQFTVFTKDMVLAAVRKQGDMLYAAGKYIDDDAVLLAAINSDYDALEGCEYCSSVYKRRDIALFAVRQNWRALRWFKKFQSDREIVSVAVSQSASAFEYVSPKLRQDPEMIEIASVMARYEEPVDRLMLSIEPRRS